MSMNQKKVMQSIRRRIGVGVSVAASAAGALSAASAAECENRRRNGFAVRQSRADGFASEWDAGSIGLDRALRQAQARAAEPTRLRKAARKRLVA